ncbi:Pectin lyase-like superfamily protein [Melia azedarach]|uniref:Pectin lyase-like superfamily protein n=1 Tax=Melia azedarach TaxID=155640 RepID=A0ACC1Y1Z3_MELAZ|nr:Pectin lyase-like superfamily protein [Melia azedarach]
MNKFCAAAASLLLIFLANISCSINAVNVLDYAAKGDGKTIDNEALNFIGCNGVSVSNITSEDSPQVHMSVYQSNNTDIGFVNIKAPEDSPNTDGIHIQNSQDVRVHNSDIGTGDDCVSVGDQTRNINVTDVHCGPGHGVSVGSLGKDETTTVQVSHITVTNVNFTGTTNGARIKTWAGRGVQLEDVIFAEAKGTSASEVAIKLDCSEFVPCTNIVLDTITLTSAISEKQLISNRNHAQGHLKNTVLPNSSAYLVTSILHSSVAADAIAHIHQHKHFEL